MGALPAKELGADAVTSTAMPQPSVIPVEVKTAEELRAAVSAGARHIRVLEHLDLRGQPLALAGQDPASHLGNISTTTHTITGKCSGAVPGALLDAAGSEAVEPGQCAIVVDVSLLAVIHGRLWIDRLFIAWRPSSRTSTVDLIFCGDVQKLTDSSGGSFAGGSSSMWLTRSVLQGDTAAGPSVHPSTGVAVFSTLTAHDVVVRQTGGDFVPVFVSGTAVFEACSFEDNIATPDGTGVSYTSTDSVTWLKGVSFAGSTEPHIAKESSGAVFSSEKGLQVYTTQESKAVFPQPVPVQTQWTAQFLSFADPWFLAAAQEAGYSLADLSAFGNGGTRASTAADGGNSTSSASRQTVIIAVAAALSALLLAAGLAAFFFLRRRRRRQNSSKHRGAAETSAGHASMAAGPQAHLAPYHPVSYVRPPPPADLTASQLQYMHANHAHAGQAHAHGSQHMPGPAPSHAFSHSASSAEAFAPALSKGSQHLSSGPFQQEGPGYQQEGPGYLLQPPFSGGQPHASPSMHGLRSSSPQGNMYLSSQPHTATTVTLTGDPTTVYSQTTHSTMPTVTGAAQVGPHGPHDPVMSGMTAGTASVVPNVPMETALEQLQAELGKMYVNKERFLEQYRVLEPEERRVGGQGLVQFMSGKHGTEPVAVKFFLARGAHEAEVQLYSEGGLRSMMPEKVADVAAGGARSVRGYVFPPCIVLRKGQSLKDWRDIVMPEVETVFDALSHIAQRLEQLHASGWVHRDLKPGNILRLPHIHAWTLMDFGSAGRTGQTLRGLSAVTTLVYCPPEAALARRDGQAAFEVQEAADMWALGVISFELLTHKKPFLFMTQHDIEERLCGDKLLLWEEPGEETQRLLKPLGVLRDTIMACLHRDPAQRPQAAYVRRTWRRLIFSNTTLE